MQDFITNVPISEKIIEYAVNIVKATRPENSFLKITKEFVRYGAGPRASQYLVMASKAHAALYGKSGVTTDDIKNVAENILAHRIIMGYGSFSAKISPQNIIEEAIKNADKEL
jgi:MoxR-like ATPase